MYCEASRNMTLNYLNSQLCEVLHWREDSLHQP